MVQRGTKQHKGTARGRRIAILAAVLTLVVGLLATAFTASIVLARDRDDQQKQFDESAAQTQQRVTHTVQNYFDRLNDIGAFVSNAKYASRTRFDTLVRDSHVLDQRSSSPTCDATNSCGLPSLTGVFFVTLVPDGQYDAFFDHMHSEDPDFQPYVPLGEHQAGHPYYLLNYYTPGSVDLQLPPGTDVGPLHSVSDLIDQSKKTGDAVVGSFAQDPFIQNMAKTMNFPMIQRLVEVDFFFGIPVYTSGSPEPVGWVGGTIEDFDGLLAPEVGQSDNFGLNLTVDLTKAGINTATTQNIQGISAVANHDGNAGPLRDAGFSQTKTFSIKGVDFTLTIWSAPTAGEMPLGVRITLIAGVIASFLAAFVVYLRVRSRQQKKALAAELADREQFQRDMLASVENAMVVLDANGRIIGSNPAWATLRAPILVAATSAPHRRHDDPVLDGDASSRSDTGATNRATTAVLTDGDDPRSRAPQTNESDDGLDVGLRYVDVIKPNLRSGLAELQAGLSAVLSAEDTAFEIDVAIEDHARHRWYAVRATPLRGTQGGAVVVHTDVTERKRSHDELELKATHDSLTGLLNREALEAEVASAMNQARAQDAHLAVLFIDLDGFKPINDTYGHAVGDDILRAVAQRVTSAVRTSDRVARLGGDEFVVLICPLADPQVAQTTAGRILKALEPPVQVGPNSIRVRASIGVASVEAPLGGSHETLLQLADEAMYVSKQKGGGDFTVA